MVLDFVKNNKFFMFLSKHRFELLLGLCSFLLFLSGLWTPFIYIACAFSIILNLSSKPDEIVCSILFFTLFSVVQVFFMVNICSCFFGLVLNYVIELKNKENKIYPFPLILTTVILLIFSFINYGSGFSGFEQGCMIIAIFYSAYLFFCLHKSINVLKAIDYVALGLLVSAGLGAISLLFPTYIHKIYFIDEFFSRLQLYSIHTNHLSMICLFLIAFEIFNMINRRGKFLKNILVTMLALAIGLLTMSKAFIVVIIGFVAYLSIWLIKKYKAKSLRVIIPVVVIFLILSLIFKDFMISIYKRFFVYNDGESIVNRFTTGRSKIWFTYMEQVRSSIPKMLFGVGLFSNELIPIGAHNIYLYIVSRFGFIGVIMIFVLIYAYIQSSSNVITVKYDNILPLLTYLILGIEEMIFSERFFTFFIMAIMVMQTSKSTDEIDAGYNSLDNLLTREINLKNIGKKSKSKNK